MKFTVTCPHCSKSVSISSSIIGQKVTCPYCNTAFLITLIEPTDEQAPTSSAKTRLPFRPDLETAPQLIQKVEMDIQKMDTENTLDLFYALEELISLYSDDETIDLDTKTALLVITSKKQIEISAPVKEHLSKHSPGLPLPAHLGYATLADIRERQGKYEETIQICQQAIAEGWTGDWQVRINRCRKTSFIRKKKSSDT